MDVKEFLRLKEQVEDLQKKADRAEGAKEQLLSQLKKEFSCRSVKEGKILLHNLKMEIETLGDAFDLRNIEFQDKWKDKLDG
mgnify:CR=1 FL=1